MGLTLKSTSLPRLRLDGGAVGQAIAANPDLVVRVGQFGNDEAALIVCDDDLRIFGRQVFRLGDDPDAGLRPFLAHDLPANIMGGDIDLGRDDGATVDQSESAYARHDQLI